MGCYKLGQPMKCFQKYNHICRRAGFTLIELVVVMAVTAVVMSALVGLFVMAGNTAAHQNLVSDAHTAAIQIEQQIEVRTRYADQVAIYENQSAADAAIAAGGSTVANDNYIGISGTNSNAMLFSQYNSTSSARTSGTFSPTGSVRLRFTLKFTKTTDASVAVGITVADTKTGSTLYTVSTDLHFDNLSIAGSSGVQDNGTSANAVLAYHVS